MCDVLYKSEFSKKKKTWKCEIKCHDYESFKNVDIVQWVEFERRMKRRKKNDDLWIKKPNEIRAALFLFVSRVHINTRHIYKTHLMRMKVSMSLYQLTKQILWNNPIFVNVNNKPWIEYLTMLKYFDTLANLIFI